MTKILGIETSCDDTGVAIYDSQKGIIADLLASQITTHEKYGGIVPELASRDHLKKILPLIQALLQTAQLEPSDLSAIAYTKGPGLIGALLVGAAVGRSLAYAWQIPAIGVHHLEGHLLVPMLESPAPTYPFVALLVSGGHTLLAFVQKFGQYQLLGESVDDAAGEAFDKTARLLGLPYPGGPAIAKLAESADPMAVQKIRLPRPMLDRSGLDFSFSGLKTAVRQCIEQYPDKADPRWKANIAAAFQEAVVETLYEKCRRALVFCGCDTLVVSGGVSANKRLREKLKELGKTSYYPRMAWCMDNGAMIAYAGYLHYLEKQFEPLSIQVQPRWPLLDAAQLNG